MENSSSTKTLWELVIEQETLFKKRIRWLRKAITKRKVNIDKHRHNLTKVENYLQTHPKRVVKYTEKITLWKSKVDNHEKVVQRLRDAIRSYKREIHRLRTFHYL